MATTYDTQSAKIKRQQAIADALRASGNEALPSSIHTGGRFDAPVSGWQYASKAIQQLLGAVNERDADKAAKNLDEQDHAVLADMMAAKRTADAPDVAAPASQDEAISRDVMASSPTGRDIAPENLSQAQRTARLQAAVLRGQQFGGSSAPIANEITARELFPAEPKEHVLGYGDVLYDKNNKPVAMGPDRPIAETAADKESINIVDPKAAGGYRTIFRKNLKEGDREYFKPSAAGGGSGVDPSMGLNEEALANAVDDVIRDPNSMGQYVTRAGNAGKATRDAINNAIAKKMSAAGLTNNQVAQFRARVQGELKSTKGLVEMKNAVESYEKLAKFNGDRLLTLVDGVDTTGVPALEGALRYAKTKGGSVDAAEFQSVLNQYQTEVARVVNQPRLVGQLTDTQIAEMRKVVDGSASAPQLRRVINRLSLEMDMRAKYVQDQIRSSGGQLAIPDPAAGNVPATTSTTPPAAGDHSSLWK